MISPSATTAPFAFGQRVEARDIEREIQNLEIARQYLSAIEADTHGGGQTDGVLAFYAPDVLQEEFPNRLVSNGARRDLQALREAAARGRGVLLGQRYEVHKAYAVGDTVILEVLWVGTLAKGAEMRAHFAVVLEIKEGRIHRQRNYDCFDPF